MVISMMMAIIGGAVLAIVQVVTEEFYLPASFVIAVGANAPRATGTFHNPNTFGTFLMAGVVLLFGIMVNLPGGILEAVDDVPIALGMGVTGLGYYFQPLQLAGYSGRSGGRSHYSQKAPLPFHGPIFWDLWRFWQLKSLYHLPNTSFYGLFPFLPLLKSSTLWAENQVPPEFTTSWPGSRCFWTIPLLGAGWRAFPAIFDYYKPTDFPFWILLQGISYPFCHHLGGARE